MNHFLTTSRSKQPRGKSGHTTNNTTTMTSTSSPQHPILTAEAVAALPPPGLSGPSSLMFSSRLGQKPSGQYLAFVASASMMLAHHPRQLEVQSLYWSSTITSSSSSPSSSSTSATTTASPSSSSRSSSSSERQLFVVDLSLLQPLLQGSSELQETTHQSPPSSIIVHPLLRLPSPPASTTTTTSSDSTCKTQRKLSDDGSKPISNNTVGTVTGTTLLSSTFPNAFVYSRPTPPIQQQPQPQSQQRQEAPPSLPSMASASLVHFSWCRCRPSSVHAPSGDNGELSEASLPSQLCLLVPIRGSIYVQHGILDQAQPLQVVYDKNQHLPSSHRRIKTNNTASNNTTDAEDPQLSPDGRMIAFVVAGEIYIAPTNNTTGEENCVQITFGATDTISHGVADFIAQEEMDRFRGFWWHPDSNGILLTKLDESNVPAYRILHQDVGNGVGPSAAGTATSAGYSPLQADADPGNAAITSGTATYEDHRYPFAGNANPTVTLAYVKVDYEAYFATALATSDERRDPAEDQPERNLAREAWNRATWYESPREASEYLARVNWLPDGSACAQWQNRTQNTLIMTKMNVQQGQRARTLLVERTQFWINLHHMMKSLPWPIHPDECSGVVDNIPPLPNPLPEGSFSFLFASERTGYCHLYLYTYVPGYNGDQAVLVKSVSGGGDWMVESIVGIDMDRDLVYVMGTYDSVLERHLYALPIVNQQKHHTGVIDARENHGSEDITSSNDIDGKTNSSSHSVRRGLKQVMNALSGKNRSRNHNSSDGSSCSSSSINNVQPIRLTAQSGMHNVVMDEDCRIFVDTSSDLDRPTTVQVYALHHDIVDGRTGPATPSTRFLFTLYDALHDEKTMTALNLTSTASSASSSVANIPTSSALSSKTHRLIASLPAPELISFPTSDGSETLHAALYRPDPVRHGPGPYPLVCAVYGGPHVQRVNRSWSQCADMRAQRLCSLGFCVVKCDNRGSSRRGMAFESAIARRLGRLEVLDQVAAVRHVTLRGFADPTRVGIYGWSYGGYLSAMCLCRAPDVFHVAVAGAPVTSWDGYDTHYTERYMGLPSENASGYRESAVFDHVPNMRGRLMIVHGLIDENVHFRHTARLINRLIGAGKDYDLLIFPDERHSPRRLRDRIYMEQRISDYFVRHLNSTFSTSGGIKLGNGVSVRTIPGHL